MRTPTHRNLTLETLAPPAHALTPAQAAAAQGGSIWVAVRGGAYAGVANGIQEQTIELLKERIRTLEAR